MKPKPIKLPVQTTPGVLVNKLKGKYEPNKEHVYYRNDGNKHIKSRGDKC